MSTKFLSTNGTRLVLTALIFVVIFQAFGIAPKENPVFAQSSDVWEFVLQSVADGSCFAPNTAVSISWTVKNAGSKPWVGYVLSGNGASTSIAYTNIGLPVDLAATFTTPSLSGSYKAEYKLVDETGSTVYSTRGSQSLWLDYIVADNCNTNSSAPSSQNGVQTAAGGHWEVIEEQSHQVCVWLTWFGCWNWETIIDVPADRKWIPDPVATTPPPAVIQLPAPAETQLPAQLTPPVGPCSTEGETQTTPSWTRVCLGGVWKDAVIDATGNTVIPVPLPTAPSATPIPGGTPTSFNGVTLPTTAGNVISGGGVFMYMFAGTMTLPANYVLVAEGTAYTTLSAAGTSVISVASACAMPLAIIGVAVLAAYGITALIAVPAVIVHPPAVPAPVAPYYPTYLTVQETAAGLIGIPGIVATGSATVTFEVLQNDADGCHINAGLTTDYRPDRSPLQENIHETVKHHGPCNKGDIKYLIESLIRQVREFIDAAKRVLKDPSSVGANAADLEAVKAIIETFPKVIDELVTLLWSL